MPGLYRRGMCGIFFFRYLPRSSVILPLFFAFSPQPRETNLASTIAREKSSCDKSLGSHVGSSPRSRSRSRKPPNLMRQRVSNFNQARMDAFEFSHLVMPLTSLNASGCDASEMCRVHDGSVPFIIPQIYVYDLIRSSLPFFSFCEMSNAFRAKIYLIILHQ